MRMRGCCSPPFHAWGIQHFPWSTLSWSAFQLEQDREVEDSLKTEAEWEPAKSYVHPKNRGKVRQAKSNALKKICTDTSTKENTYINRSRDLGETKATALNSPQLPFQ